MGCYGCSSFAALFVIRHLPYRAAVGAVPGPMTYDSQFQKYEAIAAAEAACQQRTSSFIYIIGEGGTLPSGMAQEGIDIWISIAITSWNEKVGGSWTDLNRILYSRESRKIPLCCQKTLSLSIDKHMWYTCKYNLYINSKYRWHRIWSKMA